MKFILAVLLVTIFTGCEAMRKAEIQAAKQDCLEYGFSPRTNEYAKCVQSIVQSAVANKRKDLREGLSDMRENMDGMGAIYQRQIDRMKPPTLNKGNYPLN